MSENVSKKIICDFGDFEDEGNLYSALPLPEPTDKSPRDLRIKHMNSRMQTQLQELVRGHTGVGGPDKLP